jgi:argininosuccinate lyase
MSQYALDTLKRRAPRPAAPEARVYPDERYAGVVLQPQAEYVATTLVPALRDVFLALAVQLAEQRILDADAASVALRAAEQATSLDPPAPGLRLASGREERLAASTRLVVRERLLVFMERVLELRAALTALAGAHLTTTLLATANGQTVQPTTLGHYLAAQLGPLTRTQQRLREAFARLNRSPLGAASGMSTAMPLRRERAAALLGFDGPLENTFDALAAGDVTSEPLALLALVAVETTRLVNDLAYWARDDVAVLTPGPEFTLRGADQPQRREPRVLSDLLVRLAGHASAFGSVNAVLAGRQALGDEATALAQFTRVEQELEAASDTYALLTRVIETTEVDRAGFAARANRGFATSSELADLFAIDCKLTPEEAQRLAERVVSEATEAGIDATTLKPELIDQVALRELGRELGIEPEMLSRCLAPKRFLERRAALGGPAPAAVRAALERESFAARQDAAWLRERRQQIADACSALRARRDEILEDPSSAWRTRPRAEQAGSE